MATVSNTIPATLQAEVDAAIHWFNGQQSETFEVTGIIDAQESLATDEIKELRLVLCGGDICQQKSFSVSHSDHGFVVSLTEEISATDQTQSELDPPPGARQNWLDSVISKHKFVVLVFYRGFW